VTPERAAGQALLDELAAGLSGFERSPMFGSSGVRRDGRLFAFVGGEGELIVRLQWAHAEMLKSADQAGDVRMGRGIARGWVAVPRPEDAGPGIWPELLNAAYAHAG
jgi:hypothetical protein